MDPGVNQAASNTDGGLGGTVPVDLSNGGKDGKGIKEER